MSRSYACIISPDAKRDHDALLRIAHQFSYSIELLDDGILFDVSGLEKLVGEQNAISQKILAELKKNAISGSIVVAETTDVAILLARDNVDQLSAVSSQTSNPKSQIQNPKSTACHVASPEDLPQLPLENLSIADDTLNVFSNLGIKSVRDLAQVPKDELINRYGQQFKNVLDVIEKKSGRLLTSNVKENEVNWNYQLDFPVEDFEQLIFILHHGLDKLLVETSRRGFSTEHLDIFFKLRDRTDRTYEVKTSFPTLDRSFWVKLINLRISLDPPASEIVTIRVTSHFTPPRPAQRGLYAVSRPDPERLLLTVNKLKKLVGESQVGVPVLLDQRLTRAFDLDAEAIPKGEEIQNPKSKIQNSLIAFSYYDPPIPVEVLVRDKKLIFIRTQFFSGHVTKYSGVWKTNSKWWDKSWRTEEWDVEIEDHGVYRLCKVGDDWFLAGEYD